MKDGGARVIIADDTDVFALLVYFKYAGSLGNSPIYMESPIRQRGVIDIDATVNANPLIIPNLLAAHALSGCDTVASYFGIGKGKALKVLRSGTEHTHCGGDMTLGRICTHFTKPLLYYSGFLMIIISLTLHYYFSQVQ